jgi:Bifunctional DNA primase/polymerase, N-terminal
VTTLPLAFAGIPTIPVRVWQDEGRWRKQSLAEWDQATVDEATLERRQAKWPDARPGIPLSRVGWCVVDVDDPTDEAWLGLQPLRMLGPHSRIETPSGGLHLVFAQTDPPISKFQWSPGVEILGSSCLLTVHDVEEILFPRVAPRAVLPEVFWKPLAVPQKDLIKNREAVVEPVRDVAEVADATAALWKMDVCDWRDDYFGWFALLTGAKFVGISCREFVRWSVSDPQYAADGRQIERMWEACEPRHGGAFYAALAQRGVKLRKRSAVFNEVSDGARAEPRPSPKPDLRDQSRGLIRWLNRDPSEGRLFYVACIFAERGMLQGVAADVLKSNCEPLRKALGADEFSRTIGNAFDHINAKRTETA